MFLEQAVLEVMTGIPELIALLGSADNILPRGDIQNHPLPYLVHFPVSAAPLHVHSRSGSSLVAQEHYPFYQVSVFGSTPLVCRQIAEVLKASLDGFFEVGSPATSIEIFLVNERMIDYEQDVMVSHMAIDFQVFYENPLL